MIAARQPLWIRIVVVDADDVRCHAFPSVVANHRPRRIERVGQVIERAHVVSLCGVVRKIRHTPRFVHGHPGDDARVTGIARDRGRPFARDALNRLLCEAVGARHLRPDQQAQDIGPIEVPGILELLMLPDSVEAHRLRELDVPAQGLIVWCRHAALGPIPLIEHQTLPVGAVVEHKAIALGPDRAERCVARHRVDELAAIGPEFHRRVNQRRRLGTPQQLVPVVVDPWVRQRDAAVDLAVDHRIRVISNEVIPNRQARVQSKPVASRARQPALQSHFPALDVRRPPKILNGDTRDHLHPDGLPDAGRPRIPDGMGRNLPVLLAARLREILRVVFGANDELDRRLVGASCDVERERRIAALVSAEASAVDPDRGVVVHRAEVQEDPVALRDRWQNQRRAIPARAQE